MSVSQLICKPKYENIDKLKTLIRQKHLTTKLVKLNPKLFKGCIAHEVRNEEGNRTGFYMQFLHDIRKIQFMDKHDIESAYQLGSYWVDVDAIDKVIVPQFQNLLSDYSDSILILDEIGRAQLLSLSFQHMVETIFNRPEVMMLATIVWAEDPDQQHKNTEDLSSVQSYKDASDLNVTLTQDNRQIREDLLGYFVKHIEYYNALTDKQKDEFKKLVKQAAANQDFILLKKLFKNVLEYVGNNKVSFYDKGAVVQGNHDEHHVLNNDGVLSCDCPLFNGTGQFEGKASICSHVISYQLIRDSK